MKKKLITTPIFYVNAAPHLGHCSTLLLADCCARWERMEGHQVLFVTGTDEHGVKIERAASAKGMAPKEFCDVVSETYRSLGKALELSADVFIRTTEPRHRVGVEHVWRQLEARGLIGRGKYEGFYCVPDESFVSSVGFREDGTPYSLESGHVVEYQSEENYVFPLADFTDQVREWASRPGTVIPEMRQQEVLHQINQNDMKSLSVSRPSSRTKWGIPVPGDASQIVYVWLDALSNYLSCLNYGSAEAESSGFWPPFAQFIGKDIVKFHCLYWPAFLMGCGLAPPQHIVCHGHWTNEGRKMSKSLGNVVDPIQLLQSMGLEGVRWSLITETSLSGDADFQGASMQEKANADLADTFGNLVRRCTARSLNPSRKHPPFGTAIPPAPPVIGALEEQVRLHMGAMNFRGAAEAIMEAAREANRLFGTATPWAKEAHEREPILAQSIESVRCLATAMQPFTPTISDQVLTALGVPKHQRTSSHIRYMSLGTSLVGNDLSPFDRFLVYEKRVPSKKNFQ